MADYINPYRKFTGIFIPDWLLIRSELSHAAKLCYGILTRHADKNGICNMSYPTIASKIGLKRRAVIKHINDLKKYHLIASKSGKRYDANTYKFYAHQWMINDPGVHDTARLNDPGVHDTARLNDPGVHDTARLNDPGVHDTARLNTAPTKGRGDISQDFANPGVHDTAPNIYICINNIYIHKYQKFYETYPLKKCKGDARKAYLKIMAGKTEEQCTELADKMINAINLQMTERELKTKHNVWMPAWKHPAAWLRGECWEDEVCINNEEIKNASNQRAKTGKSGIDYLDAC